MSENKEKDTKKPASGKSKEKNTEPKPTKTRPSITKHQKTETLPEAENKPETEKPAISKTKVKPSKSFSEKEEKQSDDTLISIIKEAKKKSKQRKFTQSWDLSVNLKGLDLRKPENRFTAEVPLPGGRGKDLKVVVIADSLAAEAEKAGATLVIKKNEIAGLSKDKKKLKKIANDNDWFFGEAPLMPEIAKALGIVLGPRGKIPKPIPPKAKVELFIKPFKNSVRVVVKENPVVHVTVGTEKMDDEKVASNIEAVYSLIKDRLPKGRNNIRSAYLKLTMGSPVKLNLK